MEDMQAASYGTESLSALTRLFDASLECEATCSSTSHSGATTQRCPGNGTLVKSTTALTASKTMGKRRTYNYSDKCIWTPEELAETTLTAQAAENLTASLPVAEAPDSRNRPEYTIQYGFDVTSEDVYLGLGGKCNSMQHADHLKVTIELPLVKSKEEVQVDVTGKGVVELRSMDYRLSLPLPNQVDENKGIATWDSDLRRLTLRLPLVKMFPF